MGFICRQLSSLEKVFLDGTVPKKDFTNMSCLKNERVSYQIALKEDFIENTSVQIPLKVTVKSKLKKKITVRKVGHVPSLLPVNRLYDDNYLRLTPGLFPDPLLPIQNGEVGIICHSWLSLWITVDLDGSTPAGDYEITVIVKRDDETVAEKTMWLHVVDALLPPQKLIFTQWFHCDCIATQYHTRVFSQKHWKLIDKFMKMAADNGINMLLTPVFTPPLDTAVGGERPTVQLVDVQKDGDRYTFDFEKLEKWIGLCQKNGIRYLEISHLFTQWGAEFTPKIMARENGKTKRIFGWDVRADSEAYENFLDQFLPKLSAFLKEKHMQEYTYFHVSDEPHIDHLEQYKKAKSLIVKHLKGYKIIDALSDFDFYKEGVVEYPIPCSNAIEPFLENNVPNLWTYYCCGQGFKVSNRFFSMPSQRNRILGIQLYQYDIAGFLHWGYNFYYTRFSLRAVDPFAETDAGGHFPSGDSFSVYPLADGPGESLRIVVFHEGLQDMRALSLLEQYIGKDAVVALIEKIAKQEITFRSYPKTADFILRLRKEVNRLIEQYSKR